MASSKVVFDVSFTKNGFTLRGSKGSLKVEKTDSGLKISTPDAYEIASASSPSGKKGSKKKSSAK